MPISRREFVAASAAGAALAGLDTTAFAAGSGEPDVKIGRAHV